MARWSMWNSMGRCGLGGANPPLALTPIAVEGTLAIVGRAPDRPHRTDGREADIFSFGACLVQQHTEVLAAGPAHVRG